MGNPYIIGIYVFFSIPKNPKVEAPINTMVVHVGERGTPNLSLEKITSGLSLPFFQRSLCDRYQKYTIYFFFVLVS